jgi:hypothetical protein
LQISREGCSKGLDLTGGWEREGKLKCVKEVTRKGKPVPLAPIGSVTDQGIPQERKMDANLVSATGLWKSFDESIGIQAFQCMVFCDGLSAFGDDSHPFPIAWVATEGRVDDTARRRNDPIRESQVDLLDRPLLELSLEMKTGTLGESDNHQPGSVLVEAVDNPWATLASHSSKLVEACQKGIHEGAGWMAWGRMDHHPSRLVDDNDLVILINDVKRDRFRLKRLGFKSGN